MLYLVIQPASRLLFIQQSWEEAERWHKMVSPFPRCLYAVAFFTFERYFCSVGHDKFYRKFIYFIYLGQKGGIIHVSPSLYSRIRNKMVLKLIHYLRLPVLQKNP